MALLFQKNSLLPHLLYLPNNILILFALPLSLARSLANPPPPFLLSQLSLRPRAPLPPPPPSIPFVLHQSSKQLRKSHVEEVHDPLDVEDSSIGKACGLEILSSSSNQNLQVAHKM